MSLTETLILVLYFFVLSILAIYGWHRYYLVYLYMKHKGNVPPALPPPQVLPRVTVQLPIFNEMYVLDRLLESVAAIRYPKDRLEIQVLDDSTDETTAIASRPVEHYRELGFDIHYLHRTDRTGYKAGALDAGLLAATGEFVVILITPEVVFLPNRVPCGPRSTSTRSTSCISWKEKAGRTW